MSESQVVRLDELMSTGANPSGRRGF